MVQMENMISFQINVILMMWRNLETMFAVGLGWVRLISVPYEAKEILTSPSPKMGFHDFCSSFF